MTPSNTDLCSLGDCSFLQLESFSHGWMSVLKFSSNSKNHYCYNHTYKLNLFSCCFEKKLSWQMKIQEWLTANCQGNKATKSNSTSCVPKARNTSRLCYFSVSLKWHRSSLVKSGHCPTAGFSTPNQETGLCPGVRDQTQSFSSSVKCMDGDHT